MIIYRGFDKLTGQQYFVTDPDELEHDRIHKTPHVEVDSFLAIADAVKALDACRIPVYIRIRDLFYET